MAAFVGTRTRVCTHRVTNATLHAFLRIMYFLKDAELLLSTNEGDLPASSESVG